MSTRAMIDRVEGLDTRLISGVASGVGNSPTEGANIESSRIGPGDALYRAGVDKRFNKRFSASPDYVRLAGTTEEVVSAVNDAVKEGNRVVVTSGGHCLGGFVAGPDLRGNHQRCRA